MESLLTYLNPLSGINEVKKKRKVKKIKVNSKRVGKWRKSNFRVFILAFVRPRPSTD